MVFKIYLHHTGPQAYSKVFKLTEGDTVSLNDLLEQFAASFCGRFAPLDTQQFAVSKTLAKHIHMPATELLSPGADVNVYIQDKPREDESAFQTPERHASSKHASGVAQPALPEPHNQTTSTSQPSTTLPGEATGSTPPHRLSMDTLTMEQPSQAGAEGYSGRPTIQRPHKAPGRSGGGHQRQASAIVQPFLGKAEAAERKQHYRTAAVLYDQVLKKCPGHYEALKRLIQLWKRVGRPGKALQLAQNAGQLYPSCAEMAMLHAACLRAVGDRAAALEQYRRASSLAAAKSKPDLRLDIQVALADLLREPGGSREEKQEAGDIIRDVLKHNSNHAGALLQHAQMSEAKGNLELATTIYLRLLTQDPDNSAVKVHLSACLKTEEGMATVRRRLQGQVQGAAALAFLAMAVKDQGAVQTCIQLFQMALEEEPWNASYVLNLMHAHELLLDYKGALQVASAFARATSVQLGSGFDFLEAARVWDSMPEPHSRTTGAWLHHSPNTDALAEMQKQFSGSSASMASVLSVKTSQVTSGRSGSISYSSEQLDALGIVFTAMKILYLGGAFSAAESVIAMVQGAKKASVKPLHTTHIRNETAYFSCIAQLLAGYRPAPIPCQAKPVFLCGDSHVLSGAWHGLEFRGEQRYVHPLLATGCKIWHLRTEGAFFPKVAWLTMISSLPDNSTVLCWFGEIDCREGLLLAVEKLKYDDIESASAVLIDIYTSVLLRLIKERGMEIFVLPVPSVLNETRHVVRPFNQALKSKVEEVAHVEAEGQLHFLDIFEELLTPDGLRLRPDLQFDGTHMNPGCVKVIEQALSKY